MNIETLKTTEDLATRLGRILDNSFNEIFIFDAETMKFSQVNRGARKNIGYSMEELSQMTPVDIKPEFDKKKFMALVDPLIKHEEEMVLFETIHRRKDGSLYPVEIRLQLMHEESPPVYMAIIQDITERKKAEDVTTRLGRILDNSFNEIFIFDAKTLKFVQVNSGAKKNIGYSMEELSQMTPVDIKPEFNENKFMALVDPLIKREEEMVLFETIHRRKDGSLYPVEIRLQLMHEEDPPIYVAIVQDITERKKTEEQLLKHKEDLEELVEERTKELKLSNQQLLHAEKLSAIGKLSASFAHEFNNPLYGVRNILEELKEDVPMEDADSRLVDIALEESRRMADLIEKLKSFYRPTTNEFALFDVHQVIRDMALLQKRALVEKNIKISFNFEESIPDLLIIPDQLKQVMLNILQNSQDAISDEGGEIIITTQVCQGNAEICIEDSGSGISKKDKALIFEPFFTTKPEIKGTGLGLSVSYGIIENHGGLISIESEPGKGTRVTISLPIDRKNTRIPVNEIN